MQLASGTTIRHEPRTPAVTPVQVTRGDKGDPGAPGGSDASFAAFVTDPASLTRAGLSATIAAEAVPKWKPNTAYAAGARVVNPSGDVVLAKTAFTSGASYDATKWSLPGTYAPARATLRGNRMVFLGDSITIAQGNESTTQAGWGLSYPSYATYLSKGRIVRARNAGVAGNRAVDLLNRFDTDVTPYTPALVAIMAGTNDWNDAGPTTLASYQQTIRDIVAKCRAIGAQPILCTVPPNIISTARRQRVIIGNTWLRRYATEQGIPLIDFYNLLTDPATGDYLVAYGSATNDKTHPINNGYAAMGKFFVDSLANMGILTPVDQPLPMEDGDPNNLLPGGLNLTTTGAGTTLMPTGWSVQTSVHPAGVVGSLVTGDTTIKGNWWRVVADGTATGTNNEFLTVSGNYAVGHPLAGTPKIVPGHRYAHMGRFKATGMRNADSGSGSGFLMGVAFNSVLNNEAYDFRVASTHYYDVTEGAFYQEMVAPSDAANALVRRQLIQAAGGAGTLQVAQWGLYDLTAMGLA